MNVNYRNFCCENGSNMAMPFWFKCLTYASSCFLVLNSSLNFVIYCFAGSEFRRLFRHTFLPHPNQAQVPSTQTTGSGRSGRST